MRFFIETFSSFQHPTAWLQIKRKSVTFHSKYLALAKLSIHVHLYWMTKIGAHILWMKMVLQILLIRAFVKDHAQHPKVISLILFPVLHLDLLFLLISLTKTKSELGVESNWNSFEIRSIRFENSRFDWFEKAKKVRKIR